MLYWTLVFLVIAIIAALFGFGVIASAAAGIAKILFFIFLVVFIISLIFGLSRRGTSVWDGIGTGCLPVLYLEADDKNMLSGQ